MIRLIRLIRLIGLIPLTILGVVSVTSAQTVNPNRAVAPPPTTLQNAVTANGNGTAVTVSGYATVLLDVVCTTCSGGTTVNFQASADGATFTAIQALQVGTTTTGTNTIATGLWQIATGGTIAAVRATVSGYSAGTITVKAYPSILAPSPLVNQVRDTAGFTAQTSSFFPVGGVYQSVITNLTDGQAGAVAMTDARSFHVNLRAVSGAQLIGQQTMAASLPVTIASNQTTFPVTATIAAGSAVIGSLTANQTVNVAQINGVTPLMGNGASGTGAQRVTIANDSTGIVALTTSTAQIGHLEANQSANVAQINGVTPLMGNGASGTGAQRVTIATDSTGQVALAAGAATIGSLAANQTVNVAQINGVTPLMGVGATGTGAQRVVDVASGSTGSAPPAQASYQGGVTSGATGGLLTGATLCDSQGYLDMTTATTTEIAPLVSGRTVYICAINAMANGTTVMTFKRGTGTNCGTGTASISPAWDLTAQAGFTMGNGAGVVLGAAGAGTVGGATTSGNAVCVTSSAGVNLHVLIRYAVY